MTLGKVTNSTEYVCRDVAGNSTGYSNGGELLCASSLPIKEVLIVGGMLLAAGI